MLVWDDVITKGMHRILESRRNQLVFTAIVSGCIVGGAILGFQSAQRAQRARILKSTIAETAPVHDPIPDKLSEHTFSSLETNPTHPDPKGPDDSVCLPNSITFQSSESLVTQNENYINPVSSAQEHDDRRMADLAIRAQNGDYDEDLILEQLARNRVFLTDEGLQKLRSSFIIVVGCGGVGSHTAAALARSGVSRIRLIDFDQVTLSSLNRHAVATLADVGTPKVQCIRKRLQQVTPWVDFDCRNELFRSATAEVQLAACENQRPDYVVDAIDNIDSKVELLKYCYDNKIPVVSSMGAGCKSDPTRVLVGDISSSIEDPLSRSTRRRLRMLGIASGIPVCFSTEKSSPEKAQLLPLPEAEFQKGKVKELGVLPDFRVRILPVLGTMPAVFGLCIANHIIVDIADYPHEYLQSKARTKLYEGVLANLHAVEERLARWAGEDSIGLRIPVTIEDVGYLIEEVYRGKSVVSNLASRITLIRWGWHKGQGNFVDKTLPSQKYSKLELNDIVCMTREEAARHEQEVLKGEKAPTDMYDTSIIDKVKCRMAEEACFQRYR